MMCDARINTIGEGANEVLKAFIALVGMRDIGEGLKGTLDGFKRPGSSADTLELHSWADRIDGPDAGRTGGVANASAHCRGFGSSRGTVRTNSRICPHDAA